jgi:hypothetical protein
MRRQLVDRVRFGDIAGCSAAQLDHLDGCNGCRDEIGVDQAVVRQVRRALQARVAGRSASPEAFAQIRRRALAESPAALVANAAAPARPTSRLGRLLQLRTPLRTLAAGSALALIAVVSSGQAAQFSASQHALPAVRWQGLVQTASLPVLEPWNMHRAIGIAPPQRQSGLTAQADAAGVVASLPNVSGPSAAGFFK